MGAMTIGQLARRAEVGVETVRFYERQGLIAEPSRTASGYRQYDEETAARLRFIREAKELGFTLSEIKELLSLRSNPKASSAGVKRQAEAKVADIEQKMQKLQRMKKALVKLAKACSGNGPTSQCPILEALQPER